MTYVFILYQMLTLPLTLVVRLEVTIEHLANTCLVLVSIDLLTSGGYHPIHELYA